MSSPRPTGGTSQFDFTGKTVLLTGASRGIGLGVARGFAEAGATVHILATDDRIHAAAETLAGQSGAAVTGHICDIADAERVGEVVGALPPIHVLVNNAGLERPTPVTDPSDAVDDVFRRIIDINVIGTWLVTRRVVPKMPAGGCIIITSSIWGQTAVAEFSAYCASKHANIGFMRSMARELGPMGINVNAVCPGWVRTDAAMASLTRMASQSGRDEQSLLDEILEGQSLGGLMTPADMVGAYLFLASDAAANITGQTINVDRGEVMG